MGPETEIRWEDVHALQGELRAMADRLLAFEGTAQTLRPTALVLTALRRQKPVGKPWDEVSWRDRDYFFGAMYQAMRRALIDHARKRAARKRTAVPTTLLTPEDLRLTDLPRTADEQPEQVEALYTALDRLAEAYPDWIDVVRHRYLAGLTIEQTARIMGKSEKTIRRWSERARLLLYDEILKILNEEARSERTP